MKKQAKMEVSDAMVLAQSVVVLRSVLDDYLDHRPVITHENLEFLKKLFYDIDDFCQALYHEGR